MEYFFWAENKNLGNLILEAIEETIEENKNIKNTLTSANNVINFSMNDNYVDIVLNKKSKYIASIMDLIRKTSKKIDEVFEGAENIIYFYYDEEEKEFAYLKFNRFSYSNFNLVHFIRRHTYTYRFSYIPFIDDYYTKKLGYYRFSSRAYVYAMILSALFKLEK